MALFIITVKQNKYSNGIRLEKNMSVEVSSSYSNPLTTNGGQEVLDAFMHKYGIDLKKNGGNSGVYLEVKRSTNMTVAITDFKAKCTEIEDEIWETCIDENGKAEPIIDGVVNIDLYFTSNPKILWILKEPYDDVDEGQASGGGWHFGNDFLGKDNFYKRMGRSRSTWHPIIYVSYGILNNFMEYSSMKYIREDLSMVSVIKQVAFINVKKLPGFTRTYDYSNIGNAYQKHKSTLLKQISTYNPDIIIGGSTMHLFFNDLGIKKDDIKKMGSVNYAISNSKIFIEAYHPGQTQITRDRYVNDIVRTAKLLFS